MLPGAALQQHKTDFPSYHQLKLCIQGREGSGKGTMGQDLARKLGEKVKVFDMGEIVREALHYVDPNASREEVADPKAKGKKQAEAPVDIFAGKDTA